MALGFSEEGGTLNVRLDSASSTSNLFQYLRTIKSFKRPKDHYFLRAESYYNVGTYMNELNYLEGYGGNIHARSHGEAFIKLLTHKFKGEGLYLMDEPEAALSPTMQLVALSAIHELCQNNYSQMIIATHSPILLAYPHAKIYQFSDTGICQISYEQTEHFQVTKDFLNNYPKKIQQIINDD